MARPLNTPITDEGLSDVSFFNGRVLTAEDMRAAQVAHRAQRAQVGRASGTGIAQGLLVRAAGETAPTALRVTKGLAVNRAGDPVELFVDVEVSVVEAGTEPARSTGGEFQRCEALPAVTATGTGVYVLVACPAHEPRERTPRVDVGDGAASSCGPRYQIEGVRFRLVHLDVSDDQLVPEVLREPLRDLMSRRGLSPGERSRRRNLLAHWCLGTAEARQAPADLYDRLARAEPDRYGPLDQLRTPATPEADPVLTPHDVPLALFLWEEDRVRAVDPWAVRRRIHRLTGAPEPVTNRRRAEGDAAFRQFQAHVGTLAENEPSGTLLDVRLVDYFRYLPPVGLVPLVSSGGPPGVVPETFLDEYPARAPTFAEGRRLGLLMALARVTAPVSLAQRTALRSYRIRENRAAREHPETLPEGPSDVPAPYLVLASGTLPRIDDARFDLAHWDLGHYPDPADG